MRDLRLCAAVSWCCGRNAPSKTKCQKYQTKDKPTRRCERRGRNEHTVLSVPCRLFLLCCSLLALFVTRTARGRSRRGTFLPGIHHISTKQVLHPISHFGTFMQQAPAQGSRHISASLSGPRSHCCIHAALADTLLLGMQRHKYKCSAPHAPVSMAVQ